MKSPKKAPKKTATNSSKAPASKAKDVNADNIKPAKNHLIDDEDDDLDLDLGVEEFDDDFDEEFDDDDF